MGVKVLIQAHPLASIKDVSMVKEQAKAFAAQMKEEGHVDITEVQVTWTPQGKLGGIFVSREPPQQETTPKAEEGTVANLPNYKKVNNENLDPVKMPSLKLFVSKDKIKEDLSRRRSNIDQLPSKKRKREDSDDKKRRKSTTNLCTESGLKIKLKL